MASSFEVVQTEISDSIGQVTLTGIMKRGFTFLWLFTEQVFAMCKKSVGQKQRNSRAFFRETLFRQLFILLFIRFLVFNIVTLPKFPDIYGRHPLPPLSEQAPWGIFNSSSIENAGGFGGGDARTLYYSPNNHEGVKSLVNSLVAEYPLIFPIGAADAETVNSLYEGNLFATWAVLEFNLTQSQIESGQLITSQNSPSTVDYTILVNPYMWPLPTTDSDYFVFNQVNCAADKWWTSGYMTLQNFVSTYLAKQYDFVPPDFEVGKNAWLVQHWCLVWFSPMILLPCCRWPHMFSVTRALPIIRTTTMCLTKPCGGSSFDGCSGQFFRFFSSPPCWDSSQKSWKSVKWRWKICWRYPDWWVLPTGPPTF